jgi:hypothetical protein
MENCGRKSIEHKWEIEYSTMCIEYLLLLYTHVIIIHKFLTYLLTHNMTLGKIIMTKSKYFNGPSDDNNNNNHHHHHYSVFFCFV